MKEITILMSLFLLVMSSCSKSEEYTPPREPREPKRVTVIEKQDDIQHHQTAVNQQR